MIADADGSLALQLAATRFVCAEAKLLDRGRFADWLDLFAEDGLYWLPSVPGQTDPLAVPSIVYEDVGILSMRIERLNEARALVLTPMPRTTHLVTNIVAEPGADAIVTVEAAFMVVVQQDGRERIYAGHSTYHLRRVDTSFRIVLKRVDLMDCDGVHVPITIPL